MNVYKFAGIIEGDIRSDESFPLYDDMKTVLIGAFTLYRRDIIDGWVAGVDHPVALKISTGEPFYLTPVDDDVGQVAYGLVSELPISDLSVEIKKAYME